MVERAVFLTVHLWMYGNLFLSFLISRSVNTTLTKNPFSFTSVATTRQGNNLGQGYTMSMVHSVFVLHMEVYSNVSVSTLNTYCIVLGNHPWVLAAQALQKWTVGSCTEEMLEWFNCPHASAQPGCVSSLQLCFVKANPTVEKTALGQAN